MAGGIVLSIALVLAALGLAKGGTYVRWGKTSCLGNANLTYTGAAAGGLSTPDRSAPNTLCLTDTAGYDKTQAGLQGRALIHAAKYQIGTADSTTMFGKDVHTFNMPCAVCETPSDAVLMIPGWLECPDKWQQEYKGFLVAGNSADVGASEYICLDEDPDVVAGTASTTLAKHFYFTEARCGILQCPDYDAEKELTCVVCSR